MDTDGDGVGNNGDTDDDNDGYSDSAEATAGTDPLNPESYPSSLEEAVRGIPIWLYFLATQPESSSKPIQ